MAPGPTMPCAVALLLLVLAVGLDGPADTAYRAGVVHVAAAAAGGIRSGINAAATGDASTLPTSFGRSSGKARGPPKAKRLEEVAAGFEAWFEGLGGMASGVSLQPITAAGGDQPSSPGSGGVGDLGIIATAPVSEGDIVLSVPLDVVIWRDTILASTPLRKLRQAYNSLRSEDDMFALFLIRERALGRQSRWAPYLRVLPTSMPLPLFYSQSELKALQDERATAYALNMKGQSGAQFEMLKGRLATLLRPIGKSAVDRYCTLPMYQWAAAIVGARAVHLSGERFLVPFADMVHYKAVTNYREARDGMHYLHYHRRTKRSIQILADRDTPTGHQLYEDYGDNSNYVYLNHHGFVPDENPFDCVELPLPKLEAAPPPAAPLSARQSLLKRLQLHPPLSTCLRPGPLTEEVQQYLALWCLDNDAMQRCRDLLRGVGRSASASLRRQCLGHQLPTAAYEEIKRTVRERLKSFPTTIKQDAAILRSGGSVSRLGFRVNLSANERLAVKFRLTRKRLLASLHEHFSSLAALGGVGDCDGEGGEGCVDGTDPVTADDRAERARAARLHHIVGRFNEWLRTGGKARSGLVRGGIAAAVVDPADAVTGKRATDGGTGRRARRRAAAQLVAVAQHGLRDGELVAISMSSVMDSDTAVRMTPVSAPGVWDAIRRSDTQNGASPTGRPEDGYSAREQALVLHLITETLRQPHPLGDALRRAAGATRDADDVASGSQWPGLPDTPSKWQHYLALLPGEEGMASPLLFSDEHLERMEGSPLLCPILWRRTVLRNHFAHLNRTVLSHFPQLFPAEVYNLQSYLWARATLDIRGHWWNGERHLVPLLELPMLNPPLLVEPPPYPGVDPKNPKRVIEEPAAPSGQLTASQRIKELRSKTSPELRPDTTNDWVMSSSARTVVSGERMATPTILARRRHELLLRGTSPPVSRSKAVGECPTVLTECIYVDLSICDHHPEYQLQAAHLWHHGVYTVRVEACLAPSSLMFGIQRCLDDDECARVLAFIRGAAGLQTHASAHALLLRLLVSLHKLNKELADGEEAEPMQSLGGAIDGGRAYRSPAGFRRRMQAVERYRRSETCILDSLLSFVEDHAGFFAAAAQGTGGTAGASPGKAGSGGGVEDNDDEEMEGDDYSEEEEEEEEEEGGDDVEHGGRTRERAEEAATGPAATAGEGAALRRQSQQTVRQLHGAGLGAAGMAATGLTEAERQLALGGRVCLSDGRRCAVGEEEDVLPGQRPGCGVCLRGKELDSVLVRTVLV